MHGAGGEVMGELLQTLTKFRHNNAGGIGLEAMDDGAVIPFNGENLVFTTDSHVVRPIFFPGGDIGRISVCGTINDLAMMGGKPIALSCGMIIEEGFDIDDLARIVSSMDEALGEADANLVTGDTKVMERGALDGIAINTAGIGVAKTIVRDNGLVPGMLSLSPARWEITVLPSWPTARDSTLGNRLNLTYHRSGVWWRKCWRPARSMQ